MRTFLSSGAWTLDMVAAGLTVCEVGETEGEVDSSEEEDEDGEGGRCSCNHGPLAGLGSTLAHLPALIKPPLVSQDRLHPVEAPSSLVGFHPHPGPPSARRTPRPREQHTSRSSRYKVSQLSIKPSVRPPLAVVALVPLAHLPRLLSQNLERRLDKRYTRSSREPTLPEYTTADRAPAPSLHHAVRRPYPVAPLAPLSRTALPGRLEIVAQSRAPASPPARPRQRRPPRPQPAGLVGLVGLAAKALGPVGLAAQTFDLAAQG